MSDPDQCIICLETLGVLPPSLMLKTAAKPAEAGLGVAAPTTTNRTEPSESDPLNRIACLDGCDHVLHDICIRLWAEKTNTCPICREIFHNVRVYDGVDGTAIASYKVEDKKQVADFDAQEWLADNAIDEDPDECCPCPVCNSAEREEVLLLCEGCDAAYHTYCIGLDRVPDENWYCMECADVFQPTQEDEEEEEEDGEERARLTSRPVRHPRQRTVPRTRQRLRRARREALNLELQGPWGQIAGRVYDALHIDLDNHEDDDALEDFRRTQQFRQREHREYQIWQQRINIASRLGAAEVFASNLPRAARQQLQQRTEPVQQSRDELRSWGALDRARDVEHTSPGSRKRRAPSATASPGEPVQEPERRLKRPRTRRVPTQSEGSSSKSAVPTNRAAENGSSAHSPVREVPSFLTSLLREVEMTAASDDENVKNYFGQRRPADVTSPVTSPASSSHNSPRALSLTPPPLSNGRPGSPPLSLSSYVEPRYPPANYSPTRASRDNSDSDGRAEKNGVQILEIRHPRPRRPVPSQVEQDQTPKSDDAVPARVLLSPEAKASINNIVRMALKPHWHAQELTSEQYSNINRDVSRKLYEEMRDPASLDEEARKSWENIAAKEVARAVAETKA